MVTKRRKSQVTITEVAKRAEVSKTTVSFYLNGKFEKMSAETQEKIRKIIEDMEYSPNLVARSLKSKQTNLIGVIVSDISNPFSSFIVKGIDDIARREGYQIIVGNTNYDSKLENIYVQKMFDIRVDGFIIQPTMHSKGIIEKLVENGHNIVLLDSIFDGFKGSFVKTNNYEITYKTMEQLVKKGYEEFLFISENIQLLGPRIERAKGFSEALEKYGKAYSIQTFSFPITKEKVKDKLIRNIDFSKKTLIFGANGRVLETIFKISKEEQWQMPDPLGILGFDDWGWQELTYPTVSAIDQPTYEEGKEAVEILIDMIENKEFKNEKKILECTINWRESTNLLMKDIKIDE